MADPVRGKQSSDKWWVEVTTSQILNVVMIGAHATAYQRWLKERGLYLFEIPDATAPEPLYAVGVRHLPAAQVDPRRRMPR